MAQKRVLITTFGSLGDLHPYLAIGQELTRRGIGVTVGTQRFFRGRVEAAGLKFHPIRAAAVEEPTVEVIQRVFAGAKGAAYLVRNLLLPALRSAYEDTTVAAREADVVVAHPATFATPVVAEQLGLPWLSTQLAPSGLLSAYDAPVWPGWEWVPRRLRPPALNRVLLWLMERQLRRWFRPVAALRAELGLPDRGTPLARSAQSPFGTLALFSCVLGQPQPDWPERVTVTGFPFYGQSPPANPDLDAWLAAGEPPIIFTLGSSASMDPGAFFTESAAAARRLRRRALLLGHVPQGVVELIRSGEEPGNGGLFEGDPAIYAAPYASYAGVLPRGVVTVHQGGVGTTAEALRAGRPMLVVPFGVDQPDNASRVTRLGVGATLPRKRYRADRVAAKLDGLLASAAVRDRANEVGRAVRAEAGAARAADCIEAELA